MHRFWLYDRLKAISRQHFKGVEASFPPGSVVDFQQHCAQNTLLIVREEGGNRVEAAASVAEVAHYFDFA
jgi:hypothetical protein